ncbi:hypothetical protein QO009_003068 [Brevibacillus aydinogluensis]|jgi:hypothetical protein|uniref:hypothetical protein n=1 Tax=Brevibacillus aydinogluensis TaxID=927786 RepID=UPI002893184B|nr:hypothetical protein [Brevibacillus aydinogluensis]MDT3417173.1 hypothetical protein [Brevibacillus aydinogluensis]
MSELVSTKEDLLHNVQLTKDVVLELEAMQRDANYFQRRLIRLQSGWYWLAAPFTIFIFMAIIDKIFKLQNYFQVFLTFMFSIGLYLGLCFGVFYLNNYYVRSKLLRHKHRVNEIQELWPVLINDLQNHSVVPEKYWHSYALSCIESYLHTGRADTLKECLNLYEQETHQQLQLSTLKEIRDLQALQLNTLHGIQNLQILHFFKKLD